MSDGGFGDHREKAKRAALNALRRARRKARQSGVELSEWEGDFLGSVEERVEKYGRAFADPDLGATNGALSLRQGLKLRQIAAKAKGEDKKPAARKYKSTKPKPERKSGFGKPKSGGLKRRAPLGRSRKTNDRKM
jgi:hypothetical protein